jgi:hypothetical protein
VKDMVAKAVYKNGLIEEKEFDVEYFVAKAVYKNKD